MNPSERFLRYSRQTLFRPIGLDGQRKISEATVSIVGLGALGSTVAAQLARSGVGHLRLFDRDIVETSNLQRQILYTEADARQGTPKAVAAVEAVIKANSQIDVKAVVTDVVARNIEELLLSSDLIIDGTDNLQTRYLLNDFSVKHQMPWVYGGAVSSYGTVALIRPGETPCFVCLFGNDILSPPDTCDTVGVLAPIVSIIASLQVAEALKYLTGNFTALTAGVQTVDVWGNQGYVMKFGAKQEDCRCCATRTFQWLDAPSDALTVSLCGRNTIQVSPRHVARPDFVRLSEKLKPIGNVQVNENLLRWQLDEVSLYLFPDGRALIEGVSDVQLARAIYARYIGM